MKKIMLILAGVILLLTACGRKTPPADTAPVPGSLTGPAMILPDPDEKKTDILSEEPDIPYMPSEEIAWESDGYVLTAPADWEEQFIVNPDATYTAATETLLFEICHKATYEAGQSHGWLLSIMRGDLEQYRAAKEYGEARALAADDAGWYYYLQMPTDVQFADEETRLAMREFAGGAELEAVLDDFIVRNGLTALE